MLNVLAGTMAHSLMCKLKIKKSWPSAFPKRPLNPSASASSFHIIVLELSQHKQEEDNEDNEEDTEEDDEEDEEEDDYAVQNHKHAAPFIIRAAAARLGC